MFYLAGTSISFFIALILFGKKNRNLADTILAIWLVVIGLHLFFFYAGITKVAYNYPWLLGVQLPFPLLHGPFLFLYASAQTGYLLKWNTRAILHFLPILLSYIYLIHFFLLPSKDKVYIFEHKGVGYEVYQAVNIIAIILSGLGYILLTSIRLHKHRRNILHQFSSTEKINLDWIQYLIYGIAIIWILVIYGNDDLVFSAAVFFVLFIGYFGIKQVGIFSFSSNREVLGTNKNSESEVQGVIQPNVLYEMEPKFELTGDSKKKYSKSGLTEEDARRLHEELKSLIHKEKLYIQNDLTLTHLAKKLSTHPNYLSQVINHYEAKNFYDYINTLRVEDLKERLSSSGSEKYTLLSLAFESGFNSKSTFNKYFRKVTGQTPTEYLEKIQQKKMPVP